MIDSVIENDAMFKHLEELGIKMEILLRDIMNILLLRENGEINFRQKTLIGVYFLKKAWLQKAWLFTDTQYWVLFLI